MFMNNMFENNLSALAEWYPELANKIKLHKNCQTDILVYSLESWDNRIIFKVEKNNKCLYLNGKRNVEKPLELWYERFKDINKYATVIILGVGSGVYLKKIIQETENTVNVIVYEPSIEIFVKLMESVDLVDTIKDRAIIFIIKGINDDDFKLAVNKLITLETIEHLKVEIHPNYRQIFPDDILEKTKIISKQTEFLIVNEKTGVRFSEVIARNQLINMQYVIDGYHTKKLFDVLPYENHAAILVSAGPSLNKNIKELKKAKNKLFILSVDTAVKPLIKAGIVPDAIITIDGMKPLGLTDIQAASNIPIITAVTGNCEFIAQQNGKKILYYDGYNLPQAAYMSVGKFLPHVHVGGSVACTGFSLLYMLGFNTIILVGQDLAFTNNKSHADGTFADKMPEEDTSNMIMVKGNYEDTVPTRGDFKLYLDWFEDFIKGIKKRRNIKVINATEGGAFIEGTELMTLKNAIEENDAEYVDFEKCIDDMESEFSEDEKVKIVKFILDIPEEFKNMQKNLRELNSVYKKIHTLSKTRKKNPDKNIKYLNKVKKYTAEIEGNLIYQLVQSTLTYAEWIVRSESFLGSDNIEKEAETITKQGLKMGELMLECTYVLEECANELIDIVRNKYPELYKKANDI